METAISTLNQSISAMLADRLPGKACKVLGIAEPVLVRDSESESTAPAIVTNGGECSIVYNELDGYAATMYTRLQSVSYEEDASFSFGSRHQYTKVADMSLVVFGKREIGQYSLEKMLCEVINQDEHRSLVGSEFNAAQVWSSEFPGVPYFINPDYFLFKINFKVLTSAGRCSS